MKIKRITALAACTILSGVLLSACSFGGSVSNVLNPETEDVTVVSGSGVASSSGVVDESLETPVFSSDLTGCVTVVQGAEIKLQTEASVSDGGTVTYQWYRNSVNANGGGTEIGGSTNPTLEVDTSDTGAQFFYVVATNTKDGKVNLSVSTTFEVKVTAEGSWQADETGSRYMLGDGTFLTDTVFLDGGKVYTINTDGYRTDDGQDAPEAFTSNDATMDPPPETDTDTSSSSSSSEADPSEAAQ